VRSSGAARRLLSGLVLAAALASACGADDGPRHVPVSLIFDAAPRCDAFAMAPAVMATGPLPGEPGAKVVIISVDGLRPDALFHAPAPNLQTLACQGAFSWRARTIEASYTLPSHASMVSGFGPQAHKLLHNDLREGYIAVPTVMSAARNAGKRVVLVVGKDKLIQLTPPQDFDVFVWTPDGDGPVVARALEELADGFDLMFVHLPQVDQTGHAQGWMSRAYLDQVARTDADLGPLLAALPPETTVIVSADHGGSGYSHWSNFEEDLHIPWIVRGPGIRPGRPLLSTIRTLDTAATAARVLGLALDAAAEGQAIDEPWMP
jgi:predicted AlkP superfamily pyrophosphatase or phosphodiesterase